MTIVKASVPYTVKLGALLMRSFVYTVSTGAFALAASLALAGRPLPNSFVNRSVKSSRELVAQVKHDPEVADRYERHFALNREETIEYLSSLHRDTLPRAGYYTVYSVPKDGHLKMHVERLKKGEPVFVDGAGQPILMVKCGNPLTLGPNKSARANQTVPPPSETSTSRELVDTPEGGSEVASNPETVLALAPSVPPVEVVQTPIAPPSEAAMVPAEPSVPAIGGGGAGFPWLAGLPLLGLPFLIHNGGGGDHTIAAPEPATMLALTVGIAAVARRRRQK